jgi:hypothetical protein
MRLVNLAMAVLLAASAAWADKVVTTDQACDNVKVTDYSYGMLRVRDGKTFRKIAIKDVKQLTIDGEPLLNQAEELRAQGKYPDAAAKYALARKATRGQWHLMLVKVRWEQTARLGGGATSKPGPGDEEDAELKVAPLSSLDALAAHLATEPLNPKDRESWKSLDEKGRKEAAEKYQRELAAWKKTHNYRGGKVNWVLKGVEIQAGEDGKCTVLCKSEKGFGLTAEVAKIDDEVRQAVAAHKPVAVLGTIKDYTVDLGSRSDSFFDTSMIQLGVTLSDAQVFPPGKAPKPATSQAATQPKNN